MRRFLATALILGAGLAGAEPAKVFNGTDLTGWTTKGEASYWTVEGGILKGESDERTLNSILWTAKSYQDFTLELEFRATGAIDSGVFLRHEEDQIQIGTSRSLQKDMTGSPYIASKGKYPQEAAGVKDLLKPGEWNTMKIVAKGNTYRISINGKEVLEYASDTAKESGPVGLQLHPGVRMKVEFRNLVIDAP